MKRKAFWITLVVLALAGASVALAEYGGWEDIYDGMPGYPPGLSNTAFMGLGVGSENNLYTVGMAQTGALDMESAWASKDGGYTWDAVIEGHGGADPCEMLLLMQFMLATAAIGPDTALFLGLGPNPECLEQFTDPLCLFICMFTFSTQVYYTDDGGTTVNRATIPAGALTYGSTIAMVHDNPLIGFIPGGPSMLLKTEDGGLNWYNLGGMPTQDFYANDVDFPTEDFGIMVSGDVEGDDDTWYDDDSWFDEDKSSGEPEPGSWADAMEQYNHILHRWRFINDPDYRVNYLATHPNFGKKGLNGYVYRTTDGGTTWQEVMNNPNESFIQVHMVDQNVGWILSSPVSTSWPPFGLYKTTDGGQTWTNYTDRVPYGPLDTQGYGWAISAMTFSPSGQTGFLGGGAQKLMYKALMFYTIDGGETWQWDNSVMDWGHPVLSFGWSGEHLAWQAGFDLSIFKYTSANTLPVADAGDDQTVPPNTVVTLDGTGSYDPDGDTITYAWEQVSGPTAALTGADGAQPTFTGVDLGDYVFQLTVTDTYPESTSDQVTITVAEAGDDDVDDDVIDDDTAGDDDDDDDVAADDDDDDDSGCGC